MTTAVLACMALGAFVSCLPPRAREATVFVLFMFAVCVDWVGWL